MERLNKLIRHLGRYRAPILLIAAFAAGFGLRSAGRGPENAAVPAAVEVDGPSVVQEWTCSMHPQIRQPKPGKCPICGMDLIPVTSGGTGGETTPGEIALSPQAVKLAEVQVAPVERRPVEREIRLVGKVDYDETRRRVISAWIPGRIDRVYVDFTGTPVRKGQPLVSLYSPELLSTQEELIQAKRAEGELEASPLESIRETSRQTVESAREKLRLLGLTAEQVSRIESGGKPSDHITVHSPLGGVVIEKSAVEGMYVETGTPLYSIADLSTVWVKLDVYESDLAWMRSGQRVEFESEAYPGERFTGTVAFIDPVLNGATRTVRVRVNVPNPTGKLKPEMYVRSVLRANIGNTAGRGAERELPLVIPASAPLLTGTRAVVYVAVPGKERTYAGREVVLGARAGDTYEVKDGLAEGELIVVNGAFKIDSAVQILAGPSMMSPGGGVAPAGHDHGKSPTAATASSHNNHTAPSAGNADAESGKVTASSAAPDTFKAQLDCLYTGYFAIQEALSRDNLPEARKAAASLAREVAAADMGLLRGSAHETWMRSAEEIGKDAAAIAAAKNIEAARNSFLGLSRTMVRVADGFGASGRIPVYRFHCPMADNNRGADWLQQGRETRNPYFGTSMLTCGELTGTISTGNGKS